MTLCVIYIRVSDEKQTRGASLTDQERTCRTFAERAGLKVVAIYRDDGKSAWKDDLRHRPQFEQLLAAAKSPRRLFTAVIVFKLDRFARKARIYHSCRYELERAGVQLLSATEPNESTAAGRLSSGMLAEFAEFYSAQLSERIKAAHQGKAGRGEWVGSAPFGYDLVDRRLVPNRFWLWVVCIYVAYAEGATVVALAGALNAAGVPLRSGKPWTKDSVLMVLRARAYIGQGGGRALAAYEAAHRPLVSVELWERVQAELGTRRKRPTGPRRGPRPAPLSFKPRCALCNSVMHRHKQGGGAYLRCRGSLNKTCSAKGVPLGLVLDQVALLEQAGGPIAVVWLRAPRGVESFEKVGSGDSALPDA
jgi:site-specific DNA recombinase